MEVDLEFYGWIKKANQGTEVNELDAMAKTFGMVVIKTYGKEIERALLQGEHRGALRQELDGY